MEAHAECESCGRPLLFLEHVVTGKPAPIEAEPAGNGNIVVLLDDGKYRVVSKGEAVPEGTPLHLNHYATCPDASGWRKLYEKHQGTQPASEPTSQEEER